MTRTPLVMRADDLSVFARTLSRQLGEARPSLLILMDMLARAAGYRNLQHMQAAAAAGRRPALTTEDQTFDGRVVERALHQFDRDARLVRWPSRCATQTLALWVLWAALPAGESLSEREVNAILRSEHLFDDPATPRRTMISCGLLTRRPDSTDYRRVELAPPSEERALIRLLTERRRARPGVMVEAADA